jgi:hypothetical protein
MKRITGYLASLVLGFSLLGNVAITGCAARVGVYDPEYRDYHRWDRNEDRAYHDYWRERHERERYRDYGRLNAEQQRDYWNWRHGRADRDRHDRDRDRR